MEHRKFIHNLFGSQWNLLYTLEHSMAPAGGDRSRSPDLQMAPAPALHINFFKLPFDLIVCGRMRSESTPSLVYGITSAVLPELLCFADVYLTSRPQNQPQPQALPPRGDLSAEHATLQAQTAAAVGNHMFSLMEFGNR